MDSKTVELLQRWGLSAYINTFRENEIDFKALQGLNDWDLLALFGKKLGPKGKFQKGLAEYLETDSVTAENPDVSTLELIGTQETLQLVSFDGEDAIMLPLGDDSSEREGLLKYQSISSQTVQNLDTTNTSTFSTLSKQSWKYSQDSFKSEPRKKKYFKVDNIVECYLNQTCVGRGALSWKGKCMPLESSTRGKVCYEVIVNELGADGQKLISARRFEELAQCIVDLFPMESKDKYFIPRTPAHGARPAIQPKGLLYDKYHYLLKYLRKTGIRNSYRQADNAVEEEWNKSNDVAVEEDIQWLENHSQESEYLAREKWHRTAKSRLANLQNSVDVVSKSKVEEEHINLYFWRFECLSQRWGLHLLLDDFEYLYGGKYTSLISNWPQIYRKLIGLAQNERKDIPLTDVVTCLKLIPTFFKQPLLVSANRKQKKVWKPNLADSSQGFLLYVKDLSDLEKEIAMLKEKCIRVQRTLQPFPAVVGPTESLITGSYVIINSLRFQMENPLAAFDTCFKVYHSLHCHYPCQSSYSWFFVQQAIFGLSTKWDISIPGVKTMVKAFNNFNS